MTEEKYDPYDLNSRDKLRAEEATKAKLTRETEESDIKWLMSSKRGRRIVWRLLDLTGVFRSTFNPTATIMAFNEGNRNFGTRILGFIHTYCSELYPLMIKEHSNDNGSRSSNTDAGRATQ